MNRRSFLTAAAPLAVAVSLGGCSTSFQNGVTGFADKLYNDVMTVATFLENLVKQVVAKTITAAQATQAFLVKGQPYVIAAEKIFVSLVKLAGQVSAANPSLGKNASFQTALGQATTLANNPIVQASVATNAMPSDPLTIVNGIIDIGAQLYSISKGAASPTAAAATA